MGKSIDANAVIVKQLTSHLEKVLKHAEREHCTHEETYRAGSIWEICSSCGMKWADDEGGKPADAHEFPKVLTKAREFLDLLSTSAKS